MEIKRKMDGHIAYEKVCGRYVRVECPPSKKHNFIGEILTVVAIIIVFYGLCLLK